MDSTGKKTIRIVGGGFSGLTCAYFLLKAGFQVEVLEKTSRVGGLLQTLRTPYGLVETAANAFISSPQLEDLCREIGLELRPPMPTARARFIFRGRPTRFPVRLFEIFSLLKFLIQMSISKNSLRPQQQESLRQWGSRVLSKSLSFYTIETAFQGIYAGNPQRMSASLMLTGLFKKSQRNSSQKKFKGSVSPGNGMGEFCEKLFDYLQKEGVRFHFNQNINQNILSAKLTEALIVALPAYEAAKIFELNEPQLASRLSQVEYLPVITATIFFDKANHSLQGFGCLFPPVEKNLALGVLFNHCIFEDRVKNSVSETWILGGARVTNKKEFLALSDHEILEVALRQRQPLDARFRDLNLQQMMSQVLDTRVTRWERALPHYTTELEVLIRDLHSENKNVFLHGNYLGEIGLSKLIERSALIAEQIGARLG